MLLSLVLALVDTALAAPLALPDAVRLAQENTSDSRIAAARVAEARAASGGAVAGLLPQLTASGLYQHWDQGVEIPNFIAQDGSTLTLQAQDSFTAQLNATQVLFAPGAFGRSLAAAASVDAAEQQQAVTRANVGVQVAGLWVGAWAAQETVDVAVGAKATAAQRLAIAQQGLASGTLTPLGVDRAELAVHDAERRCLDAARLRDDLYEQLQLATGVAVAEPLQPPAEPVAVTADVEALTNEALAHRPEVLAAEEQLRAARAGRWTVVGEWAPTVAATANLRTSNNDSFTGERTTWYVGASATLPLLDGGLRFADANRVGAQVEQAQVALGRAQALAAEDVRSAVRALEVARATVEVARRQEAVARHAAVLTSGAYDVGTATPVEVEDAATAALDAAVGRIRAEGALVLAGWQLERAAGRL